MAAIPQSYNHILGAWQLARIYSCLQHHNCNFQCIPVYFWFLAKLAIGYNGFTCPMHLLNDHCKNGHKSGQSCGDLLNEHHNLQLIPVTN